MDNKPRSEEEITEGQLIRVKQGADGNAEEVKLPESAHSKIQVGFGEGKFVTDLYHHAEGNGDEKKVLGMLIACFGFSRSSRGMPPDHIRMHELNTRILEARDQATEILQTSGGKFNELYDILTFLQNNPQAYAENGQLFEDLGFRFDSDTLCSALGADHPSDPKEEQVLKKRIMEQFTKYALSLELAPKK